MKELSIFNQLRPMSVGFENIFSNWERMFEDHFDNSSRYPFYNIKKVKDDKYVLEMALSGFKKSEVSVQVKDGILFISGKSSEEEKNSYLHQGIAKRAFSKQLQLSEYVECKGASMEDGMLKVELVYNPPVEKKAKVIDII